MVIPIDIIVRMRQIFVRAVTATCKTKAQVWHSDLNRPINHVYSMGGVFQAWSTYVRTPEITRELIQNVWKRSPLQVVRPSFLEGLI